MQAAAWVYLLMHRVVAVRGHDRCSNAFLGTDISNDWYSPRKSVGGLRDMSLGGESALLFLCAHQLATPKKRHIAHACTFVADADPDPAFGSSSRIPLSGVMRMATEGAVEAIDADGEPFIFSLPLSHLSSSMFVVCQCDATIPL